MEKKLALNKTWIFWGVSFTLFQILVGIAFIVAQVWLMIVFYQYNYQILTQ